MKNMSVGKGNIKVGLFMDDFSMGGAQRVFLTLADELLGRGYQVQLIVTRKQGPLLKELNQGVEVIDLRTFRNGMSVAWFSIITIAALRRYLITSKPDVLMSTLTGINIVSILSWLVAGRPTRLVVREACSISNVSSRARMILMRLLYPISNKIVVLSEMLRQELLESLGVQSEKVSVIANPLNSKNIDSLADISKDELQISSCRPYILSVGRLVPQKDHACLIKAFAASKAREQNKLVIIGDGPERPVLEKLISDSDLDGKVILVGQKDNPYPWFACAKIFAISSRWEGYSNTLMEALYFDLPVACTMFDKELDGIIGEYSHRNYYLAPVGDHLLLAKAIDEALHSRSELSGLGVERSKRIIDQYEMVLFN
jgi:glycosyltransferase involved in cell wall biosynthesis